MNFIDSVFTNESESRVSMCMYYLLLVSKQIFNSHPNQNLSCIFNSESFINLLIQALSHKFDNQRSYLIFECNCFSTLYYLSSSFPSCLTYIFKSLALSTILSCLEEVIDLFTNPSEPFQRFNFHSDFQVFNTLLFIQLFITASILTDKQILQHCLLLLTNINLLQKVYSVFLSFYYLVIISESRNNSEMFTSYLMYYVYCSTYFKREYFFFFLYSLLEHVQLYLSSFFSYIHYFLITLKSDTCIGPVVNLLQLLCKEPSSPLYQAFIHSSLYTYLVYFTVDSSINPFLQHSSFFTTAALSLIPDDNSLITSTLDTIHFTQQQIQNKVNTIIDFLQNDDLSFIQKNRSMIIHTLQEFFQDMDVLDVFRCNAITQLIDTTLSIIKSTPSEPTIIKQKLQIIAIALFSETEEHHYPVTVVAHFLNNMIYQDCPALIVYTFIFTNS